jgi:GNAT superfamily N-acetyltransferase
MSKHLQNAARARDDGNVLYDAASEAWFERIAAWWPSGSRKRFHIDDGYCIIAHRGDQLIGCISIALGDLPPPLAGPREAFIDFIEVREDSRRQGVARRLIELATHQARDNGAVQLRAWSNQSKIEAIPMWHALGFALCPADPRDEGGPGYYVAKRVDSDPTSREGE